MPKENSKQEIALPALAICSFSLWAKMFVTLSLQGSKSTRPPEDQKKGTQVGNNDLERGVVETGDDNDVLPLTMLSSHFTLSERWNRIVRNDLENIPMALILAWSSYVADTETFGDAYDHSITILIIAFTLFRYLHTLFYAKSIQPGRSIAFLMSQLCQCGFGVLLLIEGFNAIVETKS